MRFCGYFPLETNFACQQKCDFESDHAVLVLFLVRGDLPVR